MNSYFRRITAGWLSVITGFLLMFCKSELAIRKVAGVLSCNVILLMISVCTGVLTARILGPAWRGLYEVMITPQNIVTVLASAGIPAATIVYLNREKNLRST